MSSLGTKISAQHSNPSQNTSPWFSYSNLKSNLQISALNFTHRDPYLENANLKSATLCASKAMSPHLTCSGVGEGFGRGRGDAS